MLITPKKHPILSLLKSDRVEDIYMYEVPPEQEISRIEGMWKSLSFLFKSKVQLVSNELARTFVDSRETGAPSDLHAEIESQSGTVFMGRTTICYAILNDNDDLSIQALLFDAGVLVMVTDSALSKEDGTGKFAIWFSKLYDDAYGVGPLTKEERVKAVHAGLLDLLDFISNESYTTIRMDPGEKLKSGGIKYMNKSGIVVEVVIAGDGASKAPDPKR